MTTPTDPLYGQQWHFNLLGNIELIWDEYTGAGVNVGVYDDGVQYTHPDLDGNYDASLHPIDDNGNPIDPAPNLAANDSHGTAVAGIIASEPNGEGGVGVAYGATITGVNIFNSNLYGYVNASTFAEYLEFLDVVGQATNFDIMSNSWGSTPLFGASQNLDGDLLDVEYGNLVANGRGGLGTIINQAAGNDSLDANGDGTNASRYTITVAASDQFGDIANYSNYGASILVTAPAASYTTDLLGDNGYNGTGSGDGDFLGDVDYTSVFGGTSAATPVVSGVTSLMLEANDGLGWRDVQNIFAASSTLTGSALGGVVSGSEVESWQINGASNVNGGGYHVSGSYGYGMVDAYQAVRMAEAWTTFYGDAATSANEVSGVSALTTLNGGAGSAIPDNSAAGLAFQVSSNVDLTVEHIELSLNFTHTYVGDLSLYMTSPDGIRLQIVFGGTNVGTDVSSTWVFGIDNFRGSDSSGDWTVEIYDEASLDLGTVFSAELEFFGSAPTTDDVYHYTQEFLTMLGNDSARGLLQDTNGGTDWLDFSAYGTAVSVDLATDGSGLSNDIGTNLLLFEIDNATVIENVMGGDGADVLVGNAEANELHGVRGNDIINAAAGADFIYGGVGSDQLFGEGGNDTVEGGAGDDFLFGGDDNDLLTGGDGADEIDGGDGLDRAVYDGLFASYTLITTGGVTTVDNGTWIDELTNIEEVQFDGQVILLGNTAPVVSVGDQAVDLNTWIRLNTILTTFDAEGDTITLYEIWDNEGGNSWWADGGYVDATNGYQTADLNGIWYRGDSVPGEQTLRVRANDGTEWGAWHDFVLTTQGAPNTPPIATVEDLSVNLDEWTQLDSVLTTFDADGDTLTQYQLWDSEGGNSWWADGGYVDASAGYVTTDLAGVRFQGDSLVGNQTLWVRAYDGTEWSAWDSFILSTTGPNNAPEANVEDQSVEINQWVRLNTVLTTSDADGDAITLYEIWDDEGGNSWWADGGYVDANTGYVTSDLDGIWYRGDVEGSSQTLRIRVNDGTDWSAWEDFALTTQGVNNTAPTATVEDQNVAVEEWTQLDAVITTFDADGDEFTLYEVWDSEGGNNWWADGDYVDATTGYQTTDLANIQFQGDAVAGTQKLWVRVNDGTEWSTWDSFNLITA